MKKNKKWDANSVPDQKGRIAIVTGASSGIGYETARVLAAKNAKVIIAVRNQEKGDLALTRIKTDNPKADVSVIILDLASLKSVEQFSESFKANHDRIDLLINNAGVMMPPYSKTEDGFELQMGTNHFGHFALTAQLFDLLRNTSGSRVVNVSSMAHHRGNINLDDLTWEKRDYKTMNAYADSKIANIFFTRELSRRVEMDGRNPMVVAAHPGWTKTDLQRHSGLANFLNPFFAQDIKMGALPTLYAAVAGDVKSGDYYGPSGWQEMKGYPKKVGMNAKTENLDKSKRLWEISEKQTGSEFAGLL